MTRSQLSIVLALALYLPAAVQQDAIAARSDDNCGCGGTRDSGPVGSATGNARFQMQVITQIREGGSRYSGCGCKPDRSNGQADAAGF